MTAPLHRALDPEQAQLVDVVESFISRTGSDIAERIDHDDHIPNAPMTALDQAGIPNLVFAAEGSLAETALLSALVVNRLGTASAAMAMLVGSAHAAASAVRAGASPAGLALQAEFSARLALVDGLHSLVAERDGQGYRVNGSVEAAIGVIGADTLVVLARSTQDEPVALLCESTAHGLDILPAKPRTGLRGAGTALLIFQEVALGGDRSVGGQAAVTAGLQHAALAVAASAAGVAEAALEQARTYLLQRRQFGQELAKFAGLRAIVGRMAVDADLAWGVTEGALRSPDLFQESAAAPCARAAAAATGAAVNVCLDALQLHGGYGYTRDFPVERMVRDSVSVRSRAGGMRAHLMASAAAVLGPATGDGSIRKTTERSDK